MRSIVMKHKIYYIKINLHDFWGYPTLVLACSRMGIDSRREYINDRVLKTFPLSSDFVISQGTYKTAITRALDSGYEYILKLARAYAKKLQRKGIVYEMRRIDVNRIEITFELD